MAEPIGSYGLLGDTRSAALVSEGGSIDWLCVPRFDGEPLFGALVDPVHGGRWSIKPLQSRVIQRSYADRAASIETTWEGPEGRPLIREGMIADASSRLMPRALVVRLVRCVAGRASLEVMFDPRLGLPGRPPQRTRPTPSGLICSWGATAVALSHDAAAEIKPGTVAHVGLRAGESIAFVLGLAVREPMTFIPPPDAAGLLDADDRWWRHWTTRFDTGVPHEQNILRSLITLRLLTYAPSGAPVAAPTTSLPAPPGSDHTWDYRFSWPRDASVGIGAFLAFGSHDEPRSFLEWFINASRITRPRLDVLYDLDGRPVRREHELANVGGYAASKPVRIGNAAATQHQLDVYGWVLDAGHLFHEAGNLLTRPQWRALRAFADLVASDWPQPDNGIWEERRAREQFVHSKLMAWTALDRALRLAGSYKPRRSQPERWRRQRDAIAAEIRRRGWSEQRRSYTRILDRDELDASTLIVAALEFDDDLSRISSTIDAVRRELGAGGPLLYRNLSDGTPNEGAFLPCSFWLVQALARGGRVDEAEEAFDQLCALSTPLGLYAEQIDPATREHTGNFPQAFSHATFLQAAAALNAVRGTSRGSARTGREPPARRPVSARRS